MSTKTTSGMLLICIVLFLGMISRAETVPTVSKSQLLQAVENAKEENRTELDEAILAIRKKNTDISEELLPDFISFLKEKDPQVQLLGAEGLYRLKKSQSVPALTEYLKSRDIVGLEKAFDTGEVGAQEGKWIAKGFSAAILALGEIGDKSVIPLLESMRGATTLQFEFGGGPVEKALSQLGAEGVRSLSRIGPNVRYDAKVMKAEKAIREIRDPAKVPALIATVNDPNCLLNIRGASIQALGEIKEVDSLPFILATLKQKDNPPYLRMTAAVTAAESGQPQVEQALLEILKEPQNDIFAGCLRALSSINNEKYMPVLINSMLDNSISLKQREEMATTISNSLQEQLKPHADLIAKGLKAVDAKGRPEDGIRFGAWRALNRATGEEPPLELRYPKNVRIHLSAAFSQKFKFAVENANASSAEIDIMVEQKLNSIIVQWHPQKEEMKP